MKIKILSNSNGVAMAISLMAMTVLLVSSAGYMVSTMTEFRTAKRYTDSTKALWLNEAALAHFIKNPTALNSGSITLNIGAGSVVLSKNDSSGSRVVTFSGTVNNTNRQIKATFPAQLSDAFNNSISTGNNLNFTGMLGSLVVNGKTRISNDFSQSGLWLSATFQDKQEGVSSNLTTLKFPDSDNNGTADQFADFKRFYQNLASTYPANQVVYIQSNSDVLIYPNNYLAGKKLIYVEGGSAGQGSVNILFDTTWRDNENITIVSTGDVTYIEPLQFTKNSLLNTVSWNDYNEASLLIGSHSGTTYAHDSASFGDVIDISVSKGSLVVNNDVNIFEVIAGKTFNYVNPVVNGQAPPGFEGLIGGASGYQTTPTAWQEI